MALIDKLTAIADAIRSKTGKTNLLSLDDMVTEITNLLVIIKGYANSTLITENKITSNAYTVVESEE